MFQYRNRESYLFKKRGGYLCVGWVYRFQYRNRESYLFKQTGQRWHRFVVRSFNLVIESLIFSSLLGWIGNPETRRFNLVIESLIFSSPSLHPTPQRRRRRFNLVIESLIFSSRWEWFLQAADPYTGFNLVIESLIFSRLTFETLVPYAVYVSIS